MDRYPKSDSAHCGFRYVEQSGMNIYRYEVEDQHMSQTSSQLDVRDTISENSNVPFPDDVAVVLLEHVAEVGVVVPHPGKNLGTTGTRLVRVEEVDDVIHCLVAKGFASARRIEIVMAFSALRLHRGKGGATMLTGTLRAWDCGRFRTAGFMRSSGISASFSSSLNGSFLLLKSFFFLLDSGSFVGARGAG